MKIITILLFSILFFACSETKSPNFNQIEKISTDTQDSLAFELCTLFGLDQGIRDREIFMDLHRELAVKIDLINFNKFLTIVRKYGYPNERILGDRNWNHQCVSSTGKAIMLHNPYRLIYEKEYFDLFLGEVNNGNMDREFLATVLDKYYWSKSQGQKVMYGSQFGTPCIENKDETNKLRIEIGLEPLEDNEFKICE